MPDTPILTSETKRERAVLCGLAAACFAPGESSTDVSMAELAALVETAGGEPVAFLHYPVVYDGKVCGELFSVLKEYGIRRCYFGHIHGDRSGRYQHFEYDGIEFSLASADALYFCPRPVNAGGLAENGRKSDTNG